MKKTRSRKEKRLDRKRHYDILEKQVVLDEAMEAFHRSAYLEAATGSTKQSKTTKKEK